MEPQMDVRSDSNSMHARTHATAPAPTSATALAPAPAQKQSNEAHTKAILPRSAHRLHLAGTALMVLVSFKNIVTLSLHVGGFKLDKLESTAAVALLASSNKHTNTRDSSAASRVFRMLVNCACRNGVDARGQVGKRLGR
jgi:hypothetical protein